MHYSASAGILVCNVAPPQGAQILDNVAAPAALTVIDGHLAENASGSGADTSVDRWLDAPEVAKIVGCSPSRVYGLISEGRLPAVTLGRRVKVPYSALAALATRALSGVEPSAKAPRPVAKPMRPATETAPELEVVSKRPMVGRRQRRTAQQNFKGRVQRNKDRQYGDGTVYRPAGRTRWIAKIYGEKETFARKEDGWAWTAGMKADRADELRAANHPELSRLICPIQRTDSFEDFLAYVRDNCYDEVSTKEAVSAAIELLKTVVPDDSQRVLALYLGGDDQADDALFLLRRRLLIAVKNGFALSTVNSAIGILKGAADRYIANIDIRRAFRINPFEGLADVPDQMELTKAKIRKLTSNYSDAKPKAELPADPRRYRLDVLSDVLHWFSKSWLFVALVVQIFAALRPGEVAGLIVADYTPEVGLLHMEFAMKSDRKRGDPKKGALSIKDCYLPSIVCDILGWWLLRLAEMLGRPLVPEDHIFPKVNGMGTLEDVPFTPGEYGNRFSNRAKKALWPWFAYAGRHAAMAVAQVAGFTAEEESIFLGHNYKHRIPVSKNTAGYGPTRLMPLEEITSRRLEEMDPILRGMCAKLESLAEQLLGFWDREVLVRACTCSGCSACTNSGADSCGRLLPVTFDARRRCCPDCAAVRNKNTLDHRARQALIPRPCQCQGCSGHPDVACPTEFTEKGQAKLCPGCRHVRHSEVSTARHAEARRERARKLAELEQQLIDLRAAASDEQGAAI